MTVISGWNGSYGSMGPEGHIPSLDLVMRAMPGAQCVQNDCLRVSFFIEIPISEAESAVHFWP